MTSRHALSALFSAILLAGCGGGGDGVADTESAAPQASAPAPATASVPARFKPAAQPKYLAYAFNRRQFGPVATHVQEDSGAITQVNAFTLAGAPTVRDIRGDTSFAMGRWAAGTVTNPEENLSDTFTEANSAGVHYILYNQHPGFPATGTASCDAGALTAPTWVGGTAVTSADRVGTATGTAGIVFSASGAEIKLEIKAANTASSGTSTFDGSLSAPGLQYFAGGIGTGRSTAAVTLASAEDGKHAVLGAHELILSSGARYIGAFRFRCG